MATLDDNIAAYDARKGELERDHFKEWAVFYERELAGLFPDFERAASDAVQRFGRGPYLIRQVGEGPVTIPASVMYNFAAA